MYFTLGLTVSASGSLLGGILPLPAKSLGHTR
jgi:hypothetical protein